MKFLLYNFNTLPRLAVRKCTDAILKQQEIKPQLFSIFQLDSIV